MRKLLVEQVTSELVLARDDALARFPRHVVDDAVAHGVIVSVFPGVYCLPAARESRLVKRLGALAYQPGSALSHLDALDLWRYPIPDRLLAGSPVHLSRGPGAPVRVPGLEVHRRRDFGNLPLVEIRPHRLVTMVAEQAIVDAWSLLPEGDRRAPLIVGVRDRHTSAERIGQVLARQPKVAGRAEMCRILELVETGCHSELELWGHSHVFAAPGLRHGRRQYPIRIDGRTFFLDRYYEEEMVDFEMDGAAYHGTPGQRERDIRRDALLATQGILTVRFSHQRLFADVMGVRADANAILRMRRRQLGVAWSLMPRLVCGGRKGNIGHQRST